MKLTKEELKYLEFMMYSASPFRIERAQSTIAPGINHSMLKIKLNEMMIYDN